MSAEEDGGVGVLEVYSDGERLRRDAEGEMGRKLPDDALYDSEQEIGRYRYDAVKALMEGTSKGYLITCTMQRERSCLGELRDKGLLGSEMAHMGIVKVSARGVVMLLESGDKEDEYVVETVARVYCRETQGDMAFTHRISPVLRTFLYEENSVNVRLEEAGRDLAGYVLKSSSTDVFGGVVKKEGATFAAIFHGRGTVTNKRLSCIHSVAKGFSDGYATGGTSISVDLTRPDVVIKVDIARVMGRDVVLVGMCRADWCVTKPRIRLKSLFVGEFSGAKRRISSEKKDCEVGKKKKLPTE